MTDITPSYGFVLREAGQIVESYLQAQKKGMPFRSGYLNAVDQCADRSRRFVLGYSEKQIPKGTVTRTFGSSCAGIVTLLVHVHNFASGAIMNQCEADKRFCHAQGFNRLRQLVAATLETTGQGKVIFPDTNRSMASTVRKLALEVPKFQADEGLVANFVVPPRPERPKLSIPVKTPEKLGVGPQR